MKAVIFAALAALAAQAVLAGKKEYQYAPAGYHAAPVQYHPTPVAPVTRKEICLARTVPITEPVQFVCPSGYTPDGSGKCARQDCQYPQYKPVYHPRPVYGRKLAGEKKDDKKEQSKSWSSSYSSSHVEITNAYKPAYQPVHKPAYIPVPQPAPVCHTVYAAPIAVCNKGKLSGQVCIVGYAPGLCPKGFTGPDAHGLCVIVITIQPQPQPHPVYVRPTPAVYAPTPAVYAPTPMPQHNPYGPVYYAFGLDKLLGGMMDKWWGKKDEKKDEKKEEKMDYKKMDYKKMDYKKVEYVPQHPTYPYCDEHPVYRAPQYWP